MSQWLQPSPAQRVIYWLASDRMLTGCQRRPRFKLKSTRLQQRRDRAPDLLGKGQLHRVSQTLNCQFPTPFFLIFCLHAYSFPSILNIFQVAGAYPPLFNRLATSRQEQNLGYILRPSLEVGGYFYQFCPAISLEVEQSPRKFISATHLRTVAEYIGAEEHDCLSRHSDVGNKLRFQALLWILLFGYLLVWCLRLRGLEGEKYVVLPYFYESTRIQSDTTKRSLDSN